MARRVRAKHQRVDEKPDKIVQRTVRTTSYRAANRYVRPRSKPAQQRRKPSLLHHEQARSLPARKTQQPSVQLPAQPNIYPAPAIARYRRTPAVKRQPDLLGKPRKPLTPER